MPNQERGAKQASNPLAKTAVSKEPVKRRGRPKGSANKALSEKIDARHKEIEQRMYAYLLRNMDKVLKATVKKAIGGDVTAQKMLLDRFLPTKKAVEHINQGGGGGINIIVQGQSKVEEDDPIDAEFTEIHNES